MIRMKHVFLICLTIVFPVAAVAATNELVWVTVTANSEAPGYEAARAMDGDTSTMWHSNWQNKQATHPLYLLVDLGHSYPLSGFEYLARMDGTPNGKIKDYEIFVSDDPDFTTAPVAKGAVDAEPRVSFAAPVTGRYVKFVAHSAVNGEALASVAELRLQSPGRIFQVKEAQWDAGLQRTELIQLAQETLRYVESRIELPELSAELSQLLARYEAAPESELIRLELAELRRRILFAHPDLQFDDLLINKRAAFQKGVQHMVDHYMGANAVAADGLTILRNWKDAPREELLLQGKLPAGCSTHPDLSYDGERILFSFAAAKDDAWNQRYSIYEIGVDGTGLRQLTGADDDQRGLKYDRKVSFIEDWDPCYLPDGGIVFTSSRIQGQVRCAYGVRYCPTFCLYRMDGDGSNIRQLSYGDIAEYDPVVLPDGRICYTRWEYTNRHDTFFQGLWAINADGTQNAHYYGNYSRSPNVVVQAQPIPGTTKVIALAAPHHGSFKGSVITVDPSKGEDGMAPLERLTPDVLFPETDEANHAAGRYADPYPINESLFLVSYLNEDTKQLDLYLLDTLGGRERIYRSSDGQSCFSAIPLKPRPMPPVRASQLPAEPKADTGTFVISDVYQSRHAIEKDSVKYVRVNQLYDQPAQIAPKLSAVHGQNPTRILGEVPVNADGSVSFEAPAGEPLQLQLLDEDRMSVMNMRTFIYLQPGEISSCVGCHEERSSTPVASAFTRPDVRQLSPPALSDYPGGFSFVKSVQPILDRHCIDCHGLEATEGDVNLIGSYARLERPIYGPTKHVDATQSYRSLIAYNKLAKRNQETDQSRPKDYFAHQSKLPALLKSGHGDVTLSEDEWQAFVGWLDLNSPLYGDWSWHKDEYRNLDPDKVAELRRYIAQTFDEALSTQPIDALINIGAPERSRILLAPLALEAGGWGQIAPGWTSRNDAGYRAMRELVEACIVQHAHKDIAGTCGRGSKEGCLCAACWIRERIDGDPDAQWDAPKSWPIPAR